jgi:hypothetical protein
VSVVFSPAYYSNNGDHISWIFAHSSLNHKKSHTKAVPIYLSLGVNKLGYLDFKYTYAEAFRLVTWKFNHSSGGRSETFNYLFLNMTTVIKKVSGNETAIPCGFSSNLTNRSFLSVAYSIHTHMLKNSSYNISIPVIFQSPYTFPVFNSTFPGNGHHENDHYCGFTMKLHRHYPLLFLYNRTFEDNGKSQMLNISIKDGDNHTIRSVIFSFHPSGTYSNITYDPYLTLPVRYIRDNFTIFYWKSQLINTIITNFTYLAAGGAVGIMVIGTTYFYRRRSYGK